MEEIKEVTEVTQNKEVVEEFTPITSQEQFNAMVGERIARAKATTSDEVRKEVTAELTEKYKDYDAMKERLAVFEKSNEENAKKYEENSKLIEEYKSQLAKYEMDSVKTKAAVANGLPIEVADRLQGTDKESIEEDAKKMAQFMGFNSQRTAPLRNQEAEAEDGVLAAFKKMNPKIKI